MMGVENIANASGTLCDAFRRDLAENEHDDRHGDGGNGGTVVAECFDKRCTGGERRRADKLVKVASTRTAALRLL